MTTIDDLGDLRGKRVLVRSDLNVPLDGDRITDDGRIRASLPTLRRLTDAGARVVVVAHLGRPKGEPDPAYSLRPVAARLGELLAPRWPSRPTPSVTTPAPRWPRSTTVRSRCWRTSGSTRARPARTTPSAGVRPQLAALADAFVSDGFGVVHRKQASVYDVAQLLPHAMGGLVQTEVEVLRRLTEAPSGPTPWSSGGRRCPTSSASSTTCSARPTGC